MMDKAKKKVIDGIQFSVAPFPVIEALKIKALLAKTIGPALGEMAGAIGSIKDAKSIDSIHIDGHAFSGAIEKLMAPLGEEQFIELIERLFQNLNAIYTPEGTKTQTLINFGAGNFSAAMDAIFYGRIFSIYPVLLLVLETNFPDFFGKVAQGIGSLIPAINTLGPEAQNGKEILNSSETSES